MCLKSNRYCWLIPGFISLLLPEIVSAQTVGDTFIDTSEWVQSSSPIRDNGAVRGHITETMVRGYRGPGYDRYYNANNFQTATEFSKESKIQPIVYENAPSMPTSLEPINPQPVPTGPGDPGKKEQRSILTSTTALTGPQYNPAPIRSTIGAPIPNPQFTNPIAPQVQLPNGQPHLMNRAYAQTDYGQANATGPRGLYGNNGLYATSMTNNPYQPSPAYSPYPNYTAQRTNCCDPLYTQTQFVAPNPAATGPNTLQTYPQYGGNPYPNAGYGISQPYVRNTWVPVFKFRSMPYGTYLGQGWVGQPVAYVEGEPIRNFFRYVFP